MKKYNKEICDMYVELIKKTIGKVLFYYGYKMIINDENTIYFIKRYSKEIAIYVRCKGIQEYTELEFFFSAIQVPDDRIKKTNIGISIEIGSCANEDINVLNKSAYRIIEIEKKLDDLSEVVLSEIKEPYVMLENNRSYYDDLLVYKTIINEIEMIDNKDSFIKIKKKVIDAICIGDYGQIEVICGEFIDNIPKVFWDEKGIVFDLEKIKQCFIQQVYAECVLDI